jgi:hypothetical protein
VDLGLQILDARAWPNPGPRYLSVLLSRDADRLRVQAWTPSMLLVGGVEQPGQKGWQRLDLGPLLGGLPAGTCYLTVDAVQGRAQAPPLRPLRVCLLR